MRPTCSSGHVSRPAGCRTQHHDGDAAVAGSLCVVVAGRVHRHVQLPEALALVALRLIGLHVVTLTAKDRAAPRIGFEVVVPGRILLLVIVRSDEHEPITIRHSDEGKVLDSPDRAPTVVSSMMGSPVRAAETE